MGKKSQLSLAEREEEVVLRLLRKEEPVAAVSQWLGVLAGVAIWVAPLIAQPLERGETFIVHSAPDGRQYGPEVAASSTGEFLVVWHSRTSSGNDTSHASIQGRRFGADGVALDDDFQINSYTFSSQSTATAAYGPDGEFVVSWTTLTFPEESPLSYQLIVGRRFAADGSPLGEDFKVGSTPNEFESVSRVAVGPDGRIFFAWESTLSHYGCCAMGRFFGTDGEPLGPDFQLVQETSGSYQQRDPNVSFAPSGESVATWSTDKPVGSDTFGLGIQAQRFDVSGNRLGPVFQVNEYTELDQTQPQPAVAPNGEILVVWNSEGSNETDQSDTSIHGRRFSSDGLPLGPQFQINTNTLGRQVDPSVGGFDANGETLIVWMSAANEFDLYPTSVRGRRYRAGGTLLGEEFVIDAAPPNDVFFQLPSVAVSPGSEAFVAWRHLIEADILGRRYALELFADGFESGDTSRWSVESPLP